MAHFIRYDIYIPLHYVETVRNRLTGTIREVPRSLNARTLAAFIAACQNEFKGVSAADPEGPASYKGWWQEEDGSPVEIDHLTYVFVLVEIQNDDRAKQFFARWMRRLARSTSQKAILITYQPIQRL